MRVVICGAGIGGLTLAHGLTGLAEVVVLERDASASDTGGYRISINDDACQALRQVLPSGLLDEIREVSETGKAFEHFTIADSRLRPIIMAREEPGLDRVLAQRQVLRILLARDLDPRIRFASPVRAVREDGAAAAVRLTDGSVLEADLVVAADGATSTVVASRAGGSATRDLGLTGLAGWAPLGDTEPPAFLRGGPALAVAADGTGVFLSRYAPPSRPVDDPQISTLLGRPALIWGTITCADRVPGRSPPPPRSWWRRPKHYWTAGPPG